MPHSTHTQYIDGAKPAKHLSNDREPRHSLSLSLSRSLARTSFRGSDVAASGAEVRRGADHAAGEAERVIGHDLLGGTVVVLVADR